MEPLLITQNRGDQDALFSPDTNEFIHLEQSLRTQEEKDGSDGDSLDRISGSSSSIMGDNFSSRMSTTSSITGGESLGRMSSNSSLNGDVQSGRVSFRRVELSEDGSLITEESQADLHHTKKQFQSELEHKLEERKKSIDEGELSLQLMERRQLRQFTRADEYLYAMKEDLSEWFNMLYPGIDIDADNFMDRLETGEHLIRHANSVRAKAVELLELIAAGETLQKPPSFSFPESDLPCRWNVQPGTWFARDNVYNFIKFCRILGVMQCVMFETEDLVCRKNEKHVILTILEVARRGAKIGMLAPMLVQFEQEIDREIAREERERRKEEKREEERKKRLEEQQHQTAVAAAAAAALNCADMYNSLAVEIDEDREMADVEDNDHDDDHMEDEIEPETEEEEEEEEDEDYAFPIGPLPQTVTNDLKSLDEMVRELVSECQCPTQFPMIRVSEGKYRIGDTKVLIFVRILRNHVMVRVGGGWDTLQHYLDKHDPCRCRQGHRGTVGASYSMARNGGKTSLGGAICYDRNELIFAFRKNSEPVHRMVSHYNQNTNNPRSDSPGTPGRRSSITNLAVPGGMGSRRNSSNTLQSGRNTPTLVKNASNPRMTAKSSLNYQSNKQSGSSKVGLRSRSSSGLISKPPSDVSNGGKNSSSPYLSPSSTSSSLRTTASTNSQASKVFSSLFPERSNSSISLGQSQNGSGGNGPTLSNCDSSSEVSDEGYKSSQGGSKTRKVEEETNSQHSSQHDQTMTDRPESSLTEASECSSTISSSDSEQGVSPASESALTSPVPDETDDCWPAPPAPLPEAIPSAASILGDSKTSRACGLVKIQPPKFKGGSFSRQNSSHGSSDTETLSPSSPSRSVSGYGDWSSRTVSRSRSLSSENGDGLLTASSFKRGEPGRHSYRAPSATSRYMQAAEAYTASARAARKGRAPSRPQSRQSPTTPTGRGTWSARTSRERAPLTPETYSNSYTGVRTASASPGPNRRQRKTSSSSSASTKPRTAASLSTQSTPSKKPDGSARRSSREVLNEIEADDDLILKRMEEILMTYKSKVEDHLAAEGRELPKEIFEDFTTQWVNEASSLASTSSKSRGYSPTPAWEASRSTTPVIRTLPTWRKEFREGQKKETKIPIPTFYHSPIPSETEL